MKRLSVLLVLLSNVGLSQTASQQSLIVTHLYSVGPTWPGECAPGILDNRSISTRRLNYHAIYGVGTGVWTASISYSDVSCSGPFTSFGSNAFINQASAIPIASGFGYHPFIQLTVTGSATVTYSGEKDLFISGGGSGGGGVTFPVTVQQGGTNATDAPTARANLGAAASGSNSDITALTGLTAVLSSTVIPAINLAATGQGGVTGLLPNTSVAGLAASATTDTTNANNITSGTLAAARLPAFSGDLSSSGAVLTLNTVNPGSGACGDATHVCSITTNGKGLVTSQSSFPVGSVTAGTDQHVAIYNGNSANLISAAVRFGPGASQPSARAAVDTGVWDPGNCAIFDSNGNLDGSGNPIIGFSSLCLRIAGPITSGHIPQASSPIEVIDSGFGFPLTQTAINAANRQGTGTKFMMASNSVSGVGAALCTDPGGNVTTSGCTTGAVSSVFGRSGIVVSQTGDYMASQISGLAPSATIDTTSANNITGGLLGLAEGGTHASLTATGGAHQVLQQATVGANITVGQLGASDISGLAASATTDTTVASNIASGTLNAARLPSGIVFNNQTNTYTTGVQDFTSATSLKIPNGSGAAPTVSALLAYNTTTNRFVGGSNGNTINITYFTGTVPTSGNCVQWSSNGGLSDAGATCGTGGGGGLVTSVFTRTGAITAQSGDYNAAQITGLAASATTDTTNASNISSGTLGAARLPNPTTGTLGGIEAYVAVTHQWINAISTSGVPSSTQPAAADITGLAASATTDTTNAVNITTGLLALSIGGVHANLSATGGANQVLQQSSVGGNITVAQLTAGQISGLAASATTDTTNASNITSGTLAAARLPSPTASTLGGVQSKDCSVTPGFLQKINTDGSVTCIAFSGSNGDLVSFGASNIPADAGFLASNVVRKDAANVGAAAMTLDLSGLTGASAFKFPVGSGLTVAVNGAIGYDSTADMLHAAQGSADAFIPQFTVTPTNGHCASWIVAGSKYKLGDTACGSGGGGGGGVNGWSGTPLNFVSNTTQYASPVGGGSTSTTETVVSLKAPAAATYSNLQVSLSGQLGSSATLAVTLEDGTVNPSTLTCTTASGGTICQDLTHSVNVAQNDLLSFKLVSSGTVTSGLPLIVISYAVGTSNIGLTNFTFMGGIISVANPSTSPSLTVAGNSGGIPYFNSGTTWTTSAALGAGQFVMGGGPGVAPSTSFSVISSAQMAVANTRRSCDIPIGDESGAAITNAQLGPQVHACKIPAAATVVEIDIDTDGGSPSVIVGRRRCTSFTSGTCSAETLVNLLSSPLAASSGFEKCSNPSGTTGLDGGTLCSATLINQTILTGDWIDLVSGTAGGTAKFVVVHVVYTIN